VEQLSGRIAVVTGGATGMGRELVIALAAAGCGVATCDVNLEELDETRQRALDAAGAGVHVSVHRADVSVESDFLAFRDHVRSEFDTDHIHLLFNNAGIAGAGSFIDDDRNAWEKTFNVDWGGVYYGCRTFLPMLMAADEAHIVNTSSVNGLFASIGPLRPHTSYSAAKFAVRGFTEALITDLRLHAPHVKVSVVMPGHVGTSIVINSGVAHGLDPDSLGAEDFVRIRQQLAVAGLATDDMSDDEIRKGAQLMGEAFRDFAPLSAKDAVTIILDGVRANKWRILVGDDAEFVDQEIRKAPESAYEVEFWKNLQAHGYFGGFGN
jgi:NAD(P)-dependent dehydrogenase (short-subunit alcohol dehydrogenase family)